MIKKHILLDAIGMINENAIHDAKIYTHRKTHNWIKLCAAAACLCLVLAAVFPIYHLFTGTDATDTYHVGDHIEVSDIGQIAELFDGELLTDNLDLSDSIRNSINLYYTEGGNPYTVSDWHSLLISADYADYEMTMFCMFGNADIDDWKVDMVFTDKATKIIELDGRTVQVARRKFSLEYEYAYYAIFEHDGVVYDIRTRSDNANCIYDVLNDVIN